jgi:hypothetical protein
MMGSLFVISFLRGDGTGAITGVIKCSGIDWTLFALLIIIAIVLTIVAIVLLRKEHNDKVACGYQFTAGDL